MNIAIPVSNHDKHLLPTFVKVLQHFGGLEEANLCFFTTPSAKAEAHEAAAALNAAVHTFEVDFAGGWPVASGAQFAATVFTIPNIGWNGPWLWMEIDMLPVKRGWVQAIRNGYTLCGSPFMGNVVPTAWVEEGKLVVKEDDLMMMGCGVYPANMDRDQRFRPLLSDLVKPADRNPHTPFDFYLRHAMSQAGIANTTLIADMWQTHEYKRTGKGITCKPVPLDKPRRERGGLVPSDAVLVHGCKDGTLAELLLADNPLAYKIVSPRMPANYAENLKAANRTGESGYAEVVNSLPPGTLTTTTSTELPKEVHPEYATSPYPSVPPIDLAEYNAPATLTDGDVIMDGMKNYIGELIDRAYPPTGNVALSEEDFEAAKASAIAKTAEKHPVEAKRVFAPEYLPAPTVTDANGTHTLDVANPKPTRTAVEALRKSKKGVAVEIARALNLSIGDFAKLLPTLGYVIAKGGKLKSTL